MAEVGASFVKRLVVDDTSLDVNPSWNALQSRMLLVGGELRHAIESATTGTPISHGSCLTMIRSIPGI
jgi:hypothetical protein